MALTRFARPLVTCLVASCLLAAGSARAASLVERLPSSAALFGVIDFESLRKSPLAGPATGAAALSPEGGRAAELFAKAGIEPARDLREIAFGVMPSQGNAPDEVAILATGTFDPAKLRSAAVSQGGKEAKVGNIAALRMPRGEGEKAAPMFLTFLPGIAVMGSAEATKLVHGVTAVTAPARRPADVPANTSFWMAGDLGRLEAAREATASVPMAAQIQRMLLWGHVTDAVELHAIADATSAEVAGQIAGLAQAAAGLVALSQDAGMAALLAGLKVSAAERRVKASLTLTAEQIAKLSAGEGASGATQPAGAGASGAKPAPKPAPKPAQSPAPAPAAARK